MSYQVIARRWRPQRFDDVVAQPVVVRTLRNAIQQGRVAQAFVFAGPRGVGKTTTARILARALNCVNGPTPDPCGVCEPCLEIAEGRDLDVLEIDAATHTGVDNVREVIVAGLSIPPMRDRYKVFIIDEVHQLSAHSFNALLKSIEEPPPHVVFMMATTELHKVPDTVLSRAQLFEFRTIATRTIADQLRRISDADGIDVEDGALHLIARAADGSMRDAQSALEQVIAFAGKTITVADVSTVLGLVGRDLVLAIVAAVADENPQAVFELVARAVEGGHDLRRLCQELTLAIRDLLIVSVDASRLEDPEIASDTERPQIKALGARFSREDLLRAFDVMARAEADVRSAAQPHHHVEMALLRWMHLRKLAPIEDLILQMESGGGRLPSAPAPSSPRPARGTDASKSSVTSALVDKVLGAKTAGPSPGAQTLPPVAPPENAPKLEKRRAVAAESSAEPEPTKPSDGDSKQTFLAEIQKGKPTFFGMVVAQAYRIDFGADTVTFAFSATHRMLREQLEQNRPWLEGIAGRVTGRRMKVATAQADSEPVATAPAPNPVARDTRSPDLKAEALANPGVQALLEMFPAEIRDVEEL